MRVYRFRGVVYYDVEIKAESEAEAREELYHVNLDKYYQDRRGDLEDFDCEEIE
jgi:hypothetical protein